MWRLRLNRYKLDTLQGTMVKCTPVRGCIIAGFHQRNTDQDLKSRIRRPLRSHERPKFCRRCRNLKTKLRTRKKIIMTNEDTHERTINDGTQEFDFKKKNPGGGACYDDLQEVGTLMAWVTNPRQRDRPTDIQHKNFSLIHISLSYIPQ